MQRLMESHGLPDHRAPLPAVHPAPPHVTELPFGGGQVRRKSPVVQEDVHQEPLLGKHSKWYQRRKEMEAELRHEFSLPEEASAVLRELRARRSSQVGCPPPVPKPRVGKSKLPPIPKPLEQQHRQPRWGVVDNPPIVVAAGQEEGVQIPWWKLEQESLARHNSERSAGMKEQRQHPEEMPPPHVKQPSEDGLVMDRTVQQRPQSWRMGRPAGHKQSFVASPTEGRQEQTADRPPDVGGGARGTNDQPWRAKAQELEAIAAEHRRRHEEKHRQAEKHGIPSGYPPIKQDEVFQKERPAHDALLELRRREEKRFEEMKQEENRRLEQERQEAKRRRQEQEEWEQAMRRKFAEEAEQLKAARRQQQNEEELEQRQRQQAANRHQAERETKRKQQAERNARWAAEEKARISTPPPPATQATPRRGPAERPQPAPSCDPPPPRQARPSAPSPPGRGHRNNSFKASSRCGQVSDFRASGNVELQAAKAAAMRQLLVLRQNPSREARQKGFKELLRMWHPDKNPGSPEVATAVFQMIQSERGRVLK